MTDIKLVSFELLLLAMVIWVQVISLCQLPGASDSEEAATHTGQGTRGLATAAVLALLGVDVPHASSLIRKYRLSMTSPVQDPAPQESTQCQQLADAKM